MDAAALADKYEQALIEMDALLFELKDYNAALLIAIAKKHICPTGGNGTTNFWCRRFKLWPTGNAFGGNCG